MAGETTFINKISHGFAKIARGCESLTTVTHLSAGALRPYHSLPPLTKEAWFRIRLSVRMCIDLLLNFNGRNFTQKKQGCQEPMKTLTLNFLAARIWKNPVRSLKSPLPDPHPDPTLRQGCLPQLEKHGL